MIEVDDGLKTKTEFENIVTATNKATYTQYYITTKGQNVLTCFFCRLLNVL